MLRTKRFGPSVLLGIVFVFALTFAGAIGSVFFWQKMIRSSPQLNRYFEALYSCFVHNMPASDLSPFRFYALLLFNFGLILLLGVVGAFIVLKLISDPIVDFSDDLIALGKKIGNGAPEGVGDFKTRKTKITELSTLQQGIGFLIDSLKDRDRRLTKLNDELRKNEVLAQIGKVSSQIAHDIRSPLAALKISLEYLKQLPEQQRLLIRSAVTRIEDIANNLSSSSQALEMKAAGVWACLLTSLIEPIITEKRTQFRSKLGLDIQLRFGENAYGLFSRINPSELKRVLSNLINNAVEANIGKPNTHVEVFVHQRGGQCEIRIRDWGQGIPQDILAKLGTRGVTFGKPGGSGLGVYHALETVKGWGGTLTIESVAGEGTSVYIRLPRTESPRWFVPSLDLNRDMNIAILDDDVTIHQVGKTACVITWDRLRF